MIDPSAIVHGLFILKYEQKNKYAVILHSDLKNYLITTFTTSRNRAGINPVHGVNRNPDCYVFKANQVIGKSPDNGTDFFFSQDTVIVPDYGIEDMSIDKFLSRVSNLIVVCVLFKEEYLDLLYFLYKSNKTKVKYIGIFEKILHEQSS